MNQLTRSPSKPVRLSIHPKVVSERLGHASVSFTLEVYTHLLPDMQSEAADAIDRLLDTAA